MGFVQKEWLVYFYESELEPREDWLYFIKKGFRVVTGVQTCALPILS